MDSKKLKKHFINHKRKNLDHNQIIQPELEEDLDQSPIPIFFQNKKIFNSLALIKGDAIGLPYKRSKNIISALNSQKIQIYKDDQIYGIKLKETIIYNFNEINKNELNYEICRNKSHKIIKNLNNKKGREKLMNELFKSLSYDNTNQFIIFNVLYKLFELEYQNEFYDIINDYHFLLSHEMNIKENGENKIIKLDNLFPLNDYNIPKNEQSLKKILINILELFKKEFKIEKNILLNIDNNLDENTKNDKKDLLEKINELWEYFKNYKLIKNFNNNQPVDYNLNSNLFFIKLINIIFDIFIKQKFNINPR